MSAKYTAEQLQAAAISLGFQNAELMVAHFKAQVMDGGLYEQLQDDGISQLEAICPGWTQSRPGGLICNADKAGGIIDCEGVAGEWFVIFNDSRETLSGFATRAAAVEAFVVASL